jgi:hypothetical protein
MKRIRLFDFLLLALLWCAVLPVMGLVTGIAAHLFMLGWGVVQ